MAAKKKSKVRNPAAIPARKRKSAGPMKNKKNKRKSNKKKKIIDEQLQ